ncbi:MAG TPA: hypothetical protein VI408_13205 [Gaiellaceae bacterium]
MLVAGVRRLVVIYAAIVAVTVVLSAGVGLLAGSSLARALAVGFYVAGAVLLLGCFVFGVRGPLRGEARTGEGAGLVGARRVRRATTDERSEATRTAILLFAFGISLVILGSLLDPAHTTF